MKPELYRSNRNLSLATRVALAIRIRNEYLECCPLHNCYAQLDLVSPDRATEHRATEANNENLYLARCSVVDFRRLQAFRIQTLDVHGDRRGLQAPVQRRTNKRAGGADILTRQTSHKAVS